MREGGEREGMGGRKGREKGMIGRMKGGGIGVRREMNLQSTRRNINNYL